MWSHLCHAASPPASATWRAMRFTSTLRRVGDGASTARVAAGAADMVSGDLPTPQTCHTGLPDGCRGSAICMDNLFTTPDILLEMQKMNHVGAGIWRPQVPPVLEVVRLRKPSIGRFQREVTASPAFRTMASTHTWHDCKPLNFLSTIHGPEVDGEVNRRMKGVQTEPNTKRRELL